MVVMLLCPLSPDAQPASPPNPPAAPPATAPTTSAGTPFKAEELEQLVAPIALYPDSLLAQILMASTYPLEVVQAARFMKENPNLTGAQLNQALQEKTWDDSVKSLTTFPQVLATMDSKLEWTQKVGDAFLAQQKELMDAIQRLRARAEASGNLKSTSEQTVSVQPPAAPAAGTPSAPVPGPPGPAGPAGPPGPPGPPASGQPPVAEQLPAQIITITPTNPEVVYVPTYNPTVVYGAWPYPAYPPYYAYPPGYVAGAAFFSFAAGVAVGGALWGNTNWNNGDIDINNNNYNSYSKNVNKTDVANSRTERQNSRQQKWEHRPEHRGGAQYRDSRTQDRFKPTDRQAAQARENYRGRAEQGRQDLARGGGGAGQGRQDGFGSRQPSAQPRATATGGGDGFGGQRSGRSQQAGQARGAGSGGGGAFEGMGQGRQTESFSNRGQSSRQSMGAQRGSSGGGGAARSSGGGGASRGGGGGGRRR